MSHALSGKPGVTIIESRSVKHRITFDVDPISREPRVEHERSRIPAAPGTKVSLFWPHALDERGLLCAAIDFGWTNPHLTLSFASPGRSFSIRRTNPTWTKWKPTDPTSAYWYDVESLKTLIAAEINKANRSGEPQRTVADFVAEFRGLSGTAKRRNIGEAIGAGRERLDGFFKRGDLAIGRLLRAMKNASRPVRANDLGIIGEEHILTLVGGPREAQRYKKVEIDVGGGPYLIETAFSFRPNTKRRYLVAAINWSASVTGDPFDCLGDDSEGLEALLAEQRCGAEEPIAFFLHVATPRPSFLDKGKTSVHLPGEVEEAIISAVKHVTAAWCKQRKAEERHAGAAQRRMDVLTASSKPMTITAAAFSVMAEAYAKVSEIGKWWADARQIYYAARPDILRLAQVDRVESAYFLQTILKNYRRELAAECAGWKVAFDDRGHLTEPHTGRVIGIGTLAIREYVGGYAAPELIEGGFADPRIETRGPEGRYNGLLYVEKEGFDQLLDQAQIGARFDLAVMSCKGMSVTAARELVDLTCARFKIPLYILHDFDISGFSIAKTLRRSNDRYQFTNVSGEDFEVLDLGLRLDDVERLGLESEPVSLEDKPDVLRNRLKINGATEAEIEFLLSGLRVELNAMTSPQFVFFLEGKLAEHGVGKVIPNARKLADAYRLFRRGDLARQIAEEALAAMPPAAIAAPADIAERVRAYLTQHPDESWDQAVAVIAAERTP